MMQQQPESRVPAAWKTWRANSPAGPKRHKRVSILDYNEPNLSEKKPNHCFAQAFHIMPVTRNSLTAGVFIQGPFFHWTFHDEVSFKPWSPR